MDKNAQRMENITSMKRMIFREWEDTERLERKKRIALFLIVIAHK